MPAKKTAAPEPEVLEPDFIIVDTEEEDPAPEQGEQAEQEDPMAVATRILNLHALKKAIEQTIKDANTAERADVLEALSVLWRQSKAKTFEVRIPTVNGEEVKIAQATLTIKEEDVVVDDEWEFTEWLVANRPELVRTRHHPEEPARAAKPAWDEETPAPDAVEVLMETCKVEVRQEDTARGTRQVREIIDPATGEVIPGLRHVPTADPDSLRLSWLGPGSPGRRKALELLMDNEIAGVSLDAVLALPQLER